MTVQDVAVPVPSVRDFVALTKPRITAMVTATGIAGTLAAPVRPSLGTTALAATGVALVVAGANVLNMWIERESDARMERTRDRPIASGRVSPALGLGIGIALSLVSLPVMLAAEARVALLGVVAWITYVALYTPLKRFSAWSLPVGAIAGAMPPAMGSVAATGRVDLRAAYLFAVLFVWQLPHFMAISIMRADEYRAAGLAVGARTGTKAVMIATAATLMLLTMAAPWFGFGGRASVLVSASTGLAMLALSIRAARGERNEARDAFAFTMAHLAIVLTTLAVDR